MRSKSRPPSSRSFRIVFILFLSFFFFSCYKALPFLSGVFDVSLVLTRRQGELSDYNDVFIPWGPNWPASTILKSITRRDQVRGHYLYDKSRVPHHIGFRRSTLRT